jgi:hypothetical protein
LPDDNGCCIATDGGSRLARPGNRASAWNDESVAMTAARRLHVALRRPAPEGVGSIMSDSKRRKRPDPSPFPSVVPRFSIHVFWQCLSPRPAPSSVHG